MAYDAAHIIVHTTTMHHLQSMVNTTSEAPVYPLHEDA